MCKNFLQVYVGNTQNTLKKIMEKHFQDVAQKLQYDKKFDTLKLTSLTISTKNQPHNSAVK